jgi:4-diphosphocytidyl-2-C-methyl-D-erythritol kinase
VSSGAAVPATAPRSCTLLARAKINLSLRVLAREPTGYHQLETVFCLIELADEIEVRVGGDDVVLEVQSPADELGPPPDLGSDTTNLAYRAAVLFRDHTGTGEGVRIRLVKRVPHGAGLGGGSSDAAAVLAALNTLHGAALPSARLIQLAAALGSDVPFFVAGAPLVFAWGRGGRMAALPPLPAKPVLLALSAARVSTAEAYAALDAMRRDGFEAPAAIVRLCAARWSELASAAVNDFEPVVFEQLPQLAAVRAALQRCGAFVARLTGTGSAVFGIYDDSDTLAAVRSELEAEFPDTRFVTTTTATL